MCCVMRTCTRKTSPLWKPGARRCRPLVHVQVHTHTLSVAHMSRSSVSLSFSDGRCRYMAHCTLFRCCSSSAGRLSMHQERCYCAQVGALRAVLCSWPCLLLYIKVRWNPILCFFLFTDDWCQGYFCGAQNMYRALVGRPHIPAWLLAAVVSKRSFWFNGLLSGMSVFIEAKHRRGELAMYVLPKGLESAWVAARGKGLVFRTGKHGSALVGSFVVPRRHLSRYSRVHLPS